MQESEPHRIPDAEIAPVRLRWSARPQDGFTSYVRSRFAREPARIPCLVRSQLVVVNDGAFATPEEVVTFEAARLNPSKEAYYTALCELADELAASAPGEPRVCPSR